VRNLHFLDVHRAEHPTLGWGDDGCGLFRIPFPATGVTLNVIASTGGGWDHVSVSLPNRCPNWPEMDYIKRLFFRKDEAAMQLHVPVEEHVSLHPYCLHLWRPQGAEIPRPPAVMVA
jgi:hypothetical protein